MFGARQLGRLTVQSNAKSVLMTSMRTKKDLRVYLLEVCSTRSSSNERNQNIQYQNELQKPSLNEPDSEFQI